MPIDKLLRETGEKFELDTYIRDLTVEYVPFTGTIKQHPYEKDKIILIVDPLSTRLAYLEFNTGDIGAADELPSLVTLAGDSVRMVRIWVKKGSLGIQSLPFIVEDTAERFRKKTEEKD
ncbi:MAG: hypothetical protein M0P57_09545 [Syntrophales bacterium]|nr:hypothetical protein [Syntrophales bacterium]MDY0043243.1 hypothetical protein [Syntrophales bacterium]